MDQLSIRTQGDPQHDEATAVLQIAFNRAVRRESGISQACLDLEGMSGVAYRRFINNLVRMASQPRYLEVGSWMGSTACSVIDNNVVAITCIDNWSEFGGPREAFFENIASFRTERTAFKFIESDFRSVDVASLGLFNIYLFDGPHEEADQYDGLGLYAAALEDDLYFIVDDWNWREVRAGTLRAIRDSGFRIDFAIEVRTTMDEEHGSIWGQHGDWHNGYLLSKLSRQVPRAMDAA